MNYLINNMEKIRLFVSTKWPLIEDHIISAVITFFTGFCLALLPQLQNLDTSKLEAATILGLFLACFRAGFKMLIEQFILPLIKKILKKLADRKNKIDLQI